MKVAYNACYGGFGLSIKAQTLYANKKGITLFWYERIFEDDVYRKVCKDDIKGSFRYTASTKDLGNEVKSIPNNSYYYLDRDEDSFRIDEDLISVIEELGDEANGDCSNLCIKEIPDGAEFEITEYDGFEDVEPPRTTW